MAVAVEVRYSQCLLFTILFFFVFEQKPYVCGNDLTLADMPLAICYHRWLLTADENARASFPALDDW